MVVVVMVGHAVGALLLVADHGVHHGRGIRDDLLFRDHGRSPAPGLPVGVVAVRPVEPVVVVVLGASGGGGDVGVGGLCPDADLLALGVLEALLSPEVAAVLEHVSRVGVQGPEGSLARLVRSPGHFEEAVVEAERVSYGVLPALLILPVEGEQVHDELVDFAEGEHLARRVLDGHRDEADVGVRGLGVGVISAVRLGVGTRPVARRRPQGFQGIVVARRGGKGQRVAVGMAAPASDASAASPTASATASGPISEPVQPVHAVDAARGRRHGRWSVGRAESPHPSRPRGHHVHVEVSVVHRVLSGHPHGGVRVRRQRREVRQGPHDPVVPRTRRPLVVVLLGNHLRAGGRLGHVSQVQVSGRVLVHSGCDEDRNALLLLVLPYKGNGNDNDRFKLNSPHKSNTFLQHPAMIILHTLSSLAIYLSPSVHLHTATPNSKLILL